MNLIKKYFNQKTIIFTMIAMLLLSSTTLAAGSIVKNPHESEYGKFVLGPEMKIPRYGHHAVLLDDGRVLVVGGGVSPEIYDPKKNEFEVLKQGDLGISSYTDSATLLKDSTVLCMVGTQVTAYAIRWNPKNNEIITIEGINHGMDSHTVTLLPNGKLLIAGGEKRGVGYNKKAYLYNPKTSKFERTGDMAAGRRFHEAVLLDNGKVWIFGGQRDDKKHSISELYDPKAGKFEEWVAIPEFIKYATGTKLTNGNILFSNGKERVVPLLNTAIFNYQTKRFKEGGTLLYDRFSPETLLFPNDKVFLVGGGRGVGLSQKTYTEAEVYDVEKNISEPAGRMHHARQRHTLTRLKNGHILIVGGDSSSTWKIGQSEIFIPSNKLEEGKTND
ncbi:hypothetical protein HN928_06915 [bacterium]|jgi:hypothetical protein|nr:hypothetical protein [bacterium]